MRKDKFVCMGEYETKARLFEIKLKSFGVFE